MSHCPALQTILVGTDRIEMMRRDIETAARVLMDLLANPKVVLPELPLNKIYETKNKVVWTITITNMATSTGESIPTKRQVGVQCLNPVAKGHTVILFSLTQWENNKSSKPVWSLDSVPVHESLHVLVDSIMRDFPDITTLPAWEALKRAEDYDI